jgi:putative tryptophan/tyrosine transport system substrate-binding protein
MSVRSRRRFLQRGLALAGAGLLSGCEIARPPPRVSRVGSLFVGAEVLQIQHLGKALIELGYVPGQNIVIEREGLSEGDSDRLPEFAAELARRQPDLVIAWGSLATRAMQQVTSTIPIVMTYSGDPVRSGLVASLARPGGNVTGLSAHSAQIAPKRLELLTAIAPRASRVAVIWNPDDPDRVVEMEALQVAAGALGVQILDVEARRERDHAPAADAVTRGRADAILGLAGPQGRGERFSLLSLAQQAGIPSAFEWRTFVDGGGLLSYGPTPADLFRRAAMYVDKILQGAKPADLPVEQPTTFELVINDKTARALGLAIPQSVLQQATEVIQ